ncbi:MAG: CehA/McbA family metallohydrolase [Bacillota bacterium]
MNWYKGNPHTHTNRSDGDAPLEYVVEWYAKRGYDWLVITDHHRGLTATEACELSNRYDILVIPGNETGGTCHVVGLGVAVDCQELATTFRSGDPVESLQRQINWVNDNHGLALAAHPNWTYMWDAAIFLQTSGCNLFEVHNGTTDCNTFSAGGKQGTDEIWNDILNAGRLIYGVGADDVHRLLPDELANAQNRNACGGNSWTYIEAESLSAANVLCALKSGRCAASNGPNLTGFGIENGEYYLNIAETYDHFHYTTSFFGSQGLLAEIHGRNPRYKIVGNEQWIRARSFCSSGRYLWTQPLVVKGGW